MIPKWQRITISIVTHFFFFMQNPKYRGAAFQEEKFDIENHVLSHAPMSFKYKIPIETQKKMREFARQLWDSLIQAKKESNN